MLITEWNFITTPSKLKLLTKYKKMLKTTLNCQNKSNKTQKSQIVKQKRKPKESIPASQYLAQKIKGIIKIIQIINIAYSE